jgi:hypothetical protein
MVEMNQKKGAIKIKDILNVNHVKILFLDKKIIH